MRRRAEDAIAQLALQKNDNARAIRALRDQIKYDFDNVDAARQLADLLVESGVKDAVQLEPVYKRIIAIDPVEWKREIAKAEFGATHSAASIEEAQGIARLIGRRPDAEVVFREAGRYLARHAYTTISPITRRMTLMLPAILARPIALRHVRRVSSRHAAGTVRRVGSTIPARAALRGSRGSPRAAPRNRVPRCG